MNLIRDILQQSNHFISTASKWNMHWSKSKGFTFHCFGCKLTCVDGRFTLKGKCLQAVFISLQAEFGQVLLDLPGHLSVLVKLFGIQEGAAADSLLVPSCLGDVEHRCIGTTLAERTVYTTSRTHNMNGSGSRYPDTEAGQTKTTQSKHNPL